MNIAILISLLCQDHKSWMETYPNIHPRTKLGALSMESPGTKEYCEKEAKKMLETP